jgi:hypothetical protein
VIAGEHYYCGKEFKRTLENGVMLTSWTLGKHGGTPDEPADAKVKIYEAGKVKVPVSVKKEIKLIPVRELKRRGFSQDAISNALHSSVRYGTFSRLLEVSHPPRPLTPLPPTGKRSQRTGHRDPHAHPPLPLPNP